MGNPLKIKRLNSIDYDAIAIYTRCMGRDIATNSNEIVYWWERPKQFLPNVFLILGIYLDKKMVGYVQMVDTPFFMCIDYIAIDEPWRNSISLTSVLDLVFTWLSSYNGQDKLIVTEIERIGFLKVLSKYGFKVVDIDYQTPLLGKPTHPMKLLANHDIRDPVMLAKLIYFDHYLHWYSLYGLSRSMAKFRLMLDDLIEGYENKAS